MQDIATKVEGSQLTADEFNQIPSELENAITSTGQTLTSSDLNQLAKALAVYVAKGDFYQTSGTANAIVLSSISNMQAPSAYSLGMRIRFIPSLNNTDIVTIKLNNLSTVNLYNNSGSNLVANDLVANQIYTATFDGSNFKISETPITWVQSIVNQKADDNSVVKLTTNQTIAGTKTFNDSPLVPTPSSNDNSTKAINSKWIRDNSDIVHVVVETYENEYGDWYRLYDDGWVEQGGIIQVTSDGTTIINLLYEFLNTNYTAFKNYCSSASGTYIADNEGSIFNKTTTTCQTANALVDTSSFEWIAFGKGKEALV